jgi:hypothetical protein
VEVREKHACMRYVPSWPHACDTCPPGEKTEVNCMHELSSTSLTESLLPPQTRGN